MLMLEVRPHGRLDQGFDLVDDAGRTIGGFAGSAWVGRGRIRAGGSSG